MYVNAFPTSTVTRAVVGLESLSGIYACEFSVLSSQSINKSQSYTHAELLQGRRKVFITSPAKLNSEYINKVHGRPIALRLLMYLLYPLLCISLKTHYHF